MWKQIHVGNIVLNDRYCSSQVLKPKYFTSDKFINHRYFLFGILTAMESNIQTSGDLGPFPPCCSSLPGEKVQISLSLLNEGTSPSKAKQWCLVTSPSPHFLYHSIGGRLLRERFTGAWPFSSEKMLFPVQDVRMFWVIDFVIAIEN